jgi:hippurate hydrolase
MIEDGLFERWPVDAVVGMHNMPRLERGQLHFRDGPMMAAVDNWEVELTGKGVLGQVASERTARPSNVGALT